MSSSFSYGALTGLMWGCTGAALGLSVGRYIIRHKTRKRFFLDDLLHLFAVIFLIITAIEFQLSLPNAYRVVAIREGRMKKPPADELESIFKHYLRLQTAISITFWVTLWFVKFTFMIFYRVLFDVSARFIRAWWAVLIFTFVAFWVAFAGTVTACGPSRYLANVAACTADSNIYNQKVILAYSCAANIAPDLLIMALPISMLRRLQIRRSQKVGLVAIFSIAFVIIAFDLLRTVKSINGGGFSESTLYGILEMTVAVMISCLPTYRALLRADRKKTQVVHDEFIYKNLGGGSAAESHPSKEGDRDSTGLERGIPTTVEDRSTSGSTYKSYPTSSIDQIKGLDGLPQETHIREITV